MSFLYPNVAYYDEAREAARSGMFASLAFAMLILVGIVAVANDPQFLGFGLHPTEHYAGIAFMILQAALCCVAAWRFRQGRGWVVGGVVLALFAAEVLAQILGGFRGILFYLIYLAIAVGLVNGVRGAFALRHNGRMDAPDGAETFD